MAKPLWQRIFGPKARLAVSARDPVPSDQKIVAADIGEFVVMVSSPHKTFKEEREQIWDALRAFPRISPFMFDEHARAGLSNRTWSEQQVSECHLFVALFGHYAGTPVDDDPSMTYSQLEIEEAIKRHDSNNLQPPILIYRKLEAGEVNDAPAQHQWQAEIEKRFAPKRFRSSGELLDLLVTEVAAAAFARRSNQAEALLRDRDSLSGKIDVLSSDLSRKEEMRTSAERAYREQLEQERAATAALIASKQDLEIERSQELAALQRSRVRVALAGVAMGAILSAIAVLPWVWNVAHGVGSLSSGLHGLSAALGNGFGGVAAALADLGIGTTGPTDPMVIASKIRLAQVLNPEFDCSHDNQDWTVTTSMSNGKAGLVKLDFRSDNVCWSPGAFTLNVSTGGADLCELDVLGSDLANRIAKSISDSNLVVSHLRVVGHASNEPVRRCPIPEEWIRRLADRNWPVALQDRVVTDNDALARARAAIAAFRIEDALPAPTRAQLVSYPPSSMGVLDPTAGSGRSSDTFASRRVRIELLVGRARSATDTATSRAASGADEKIVAQASPH